VVFGVRALPHSDQKFSAFSSDPAAHLQSVAQVGMAPLIERAGQTDPWLHRKQRGIAWRASDSLAVRSFLRLPVDEPPPDHSTISRTRRVIDLESHRAVFTWVQ